MKTTLLTTVALAACVGTQVFAQNSKEATIAFTLSLDGQASVSTSATKANQGNWSQNPNYYKTTGIKKMTQADIIKDIGAGVLGINFSSKATLVLEQAELSGFFNVVTNVSSEVGFTDGTFDPITTADSTSINGAAPADVITFVTRDNGRSYQKNPLTGGFPVGHFQPWGQIFIKDPGMSTYSVNDPFCTNVTAFFNLQVQECYDCFYLNSFITDTTFKPGQSGGGVSGPPCCTTPVTTSLFGKGTDRYYLTLSFDDTTVNPYLNPVSDSYIGVTGIVPTVGKVDGTLPDALVYSDPIISGLGTSSQYEARFTLNGIVVYAWNLELVNKSDLLPDFVGTASYTANGYGFIQLVCQLITATGSITERVVKTTTCCTDIPWYDSWYGIGWDGSSSDIVVESNPPNYEGDVSTTMVNVPLSLSFHTPDWVTSGPVTY